MSDAMYVGIHDPLPTSDEEETNNNLPKETPPPLVLPPAIRPAMGEQRKLLKEGETQSEAMDPLQVSIDSCTAEIIALIDRRAALQERKQGGRKGMH